MNLIEEFRAIASDPEAYAVEWKTRTRGSVVGYLCSYFPEEIVDAAGALPYRLFPENRPISLADAHFQSYSCSLIRGVLEAKLSGGLDFLDLTVFPHTCDSIQRLSDIWRMNPTSGLHADLLLPAVLNTPASMDYAAQVFSAFRLDLEAKLGCRIQEGAIQESISRLNAVKTWFNRLYRLISKRPGIVKGAELIAIQRAGFTMEKKEFLSMLGAFVKDLETRTETINFPPNPKRILLSGGICTLPDIVTTIEEAGASVVWDDLCSGTRYSETLTDEGTKDVFRAMAQRYASRPVCPAKHTGIHTRGEHLVKKASENAAAGVVFLFLKFCDPHSFDYPYLKKMLDEVGIPSLMIEMESTDTHGSAMKTRCQAFIEML